MKAVFRHMITEDPATAWLSDEAIYALTLYGEAEGEGIEGQTGVANVIMNRVELDWQREASPRGVCLRHAQFSSWNPGCPRRATILGVNRVQDTIYLGCLSLAQLAMAGKLPDITGGADSYEVTGSGAYWAKGLNPSRVIGHQSFYITRQVDLKLSPALPPNDGAAV